MHSSTFEYIILFYRAKKQICNSQICIKAFTKYNGNASSDTVYRNLHLFKDIGIMDLTFQDGESLFHLKNEINTHEYKFICTECWNTTNLNLCPLEKIDTSLNGYLIFDHKFEVYGVCPSCL